MYAHISEDKARQQTVKEHLKNVARYAAYLGKKIGLESCAQLCGWLHDIGKFTEDFQDYLLKGDKKRGPDHSTAGAIWIMQEFEKYGDGLSLLTAQLIALVIMSHHGGLIDVIDMNGDLPYINRLNKLIENEEYRTNYNQVKEIVNQELNIKELEQLFVKATKEITDIYNILDIFTKQNGQTDEEQLKQEARYYLGVLCKMLYSCLIDADRYDTATFMDNTEMIYQRDVQPLWKELSKRLESNIQSFPEDTAINKLRHKISKACYDNALRQADGNIYKLNCPTGSGKTLASLRFALNHVLKYHKDHIFYIIPYITITEQNVASVKEILSQYKYDSLIENNILELHSAKEVEVDRRTYKEDLYSNQIKIRNELKQNELLAERLEHPIIFTTMVRFLNTFLTSGTKNIRPAHQFANSIIIFDEIQTIPPNCIALFNGIINFLSSICKTTIVLSTATQPLLDQTPENIPKLNIKNNMELSNCNIEDYKCFKRTEIKDLRKKGGYTCQELSQLVWETAQKEDNVLVVLNTKNAVKILYETLQKQYEEPIKEGKYNCYVLTTNLYPKHRKEIIKDIKSLLKNNERLIVISTQLIEAGVDLSFKAVYRSIAGLDNAIQCAGRCNRHGELNSLKEVYLINPNFESLDKLYDIQKSQEAFTELLNLYKETPNNFDNDINSLKSIEYYFENYQERQKYNMLYKIDTTYDIYSLLGYNIKLLRNYKDKLNKLDKPMVLYQSFKTAGRYFKVIDDYGIPVIVAHKEDKEGKDLINQLLSKKDIRNKYQLIQKLQAYTVNISEYLSKELGNAIIYYENLGIYILNDNYYDEIYGVIDSFTPQAEFF